MIFLYLLVSLALVSQLALFIYSRKLRHNLKNKIELRYNIRSRKDLWNVLSQSDLPDEDRQELQELYEKY